MNVNERPSTLERAFELTRSGQARSIEEVRHALKRERYESVDVHTSGASITKQLKAIIDQATKARFP